MSARPDRAAGRHRRAARRLRGDGRRARAQRPLGEHQGAPRLLDRAVRRRTARWSCRPSTSPCTSARCRRRSPRCCDEDHAAGRLVDPQRSVSRRHPPARHHGRHARCFARRRRAARLRRQPRAPRRRRRPRARARCPPTRRTLDEEGVVIAPRVLDDAAIDELAAQMRQPAERRADLRAQLAANRARRDAAARAGRAPRRRRPARRDCAAVLDYAERRTRACLRRAARRHAPRARRARGASTATSSCASPRPSTATG